ncbi:MAG: 3-deoxy-manno-octulosonate cytidylyltransferase, partial [Wolinella sp.]
GLYAYTQASLQHFCTLAPSMLEGSEKLEQLRALSNGKDILMTRVQTRSFGIDTPEDLSRALEVFGKA